MTRPLACLASALALAACIGDETVSGYAPPGVVWTLVELNGAPFPAQATLQLDGPGRLSGQAPCNSYAAAQTVPYPWFAVEELVATERACPELAAETRFFEALEAMTLAEVLGEVLILSNDTGGEMVFEASQD